MTSAGTGESRFPDLRELLGIATYVLELIAIAAGYFGLGVSGLVLPWINPTGTPLWPPTGLALALILLRGYRIWPAIFVGTFFSNAVVTGSIFEAGLVAVGTVLAALAGTWLVDRWSQGRKTLATPFGIATFTLISLIPVALIVSAAAIAGRILGNDVGFGNPVVTWATWWLADAAGTLIIAPAILLWAVGPLWVSSKWSPLETTAIVLAAAAIGAVAFGPRIGGYLTDNDFDALLPYRGPIAFLVVLPLMWASLRGRQRDTATAATVFFGIATWGFSTGTGAFARMDPSSAPFLLFVLAVAISLPPLILSAAFARHQETEARLQTAQDQLKRQYDHTKFAFERAKRHFQILIEGVSDHAVFMLDSSGRVASWNSTAEQIIGYAADEIIGKHYGIFYRPDERRSGEPSRVLELAVKKGQCAVEGWRIKKNGALFFVTGAVTAIRDDSGNLIGLANVIRDTTERRDAQEKLVEAREQLATAQKMEAIGKLTGGIAHDFNNLLMIIGGSAQTFKRLLDPKLPRAIEAIQTAAKRGESLTRQLLTFSRRQHLSPTIVDLNASIKNMRTMIESSLRGNIVYNEEIGEAVWPVKVDLAELELAIVNIAVNARDAMPNGGLFTLRVGNVAADQQSGDDGSNGDLVSISFSDTGVGIPPNLLSKIFDPFFTTKEVGKGTGLGLSQVYGFVHQAGGTIKAESKVGEGTTFTVYLPSCQGSEVAAEEELVPDIPRAPRPTVLIVDDSAEVAEVTSSLFEHLGYDTDYRDSAEAALKVLADGTKIDLVFSDIVMPGTIDGVGLAREIRARYPNLPVVLTTGYSDAAQEAPADLKILRKPFDTAALRGCIQDMMDASLAS
jgi:PAS domain S-box-containing protein